MKRTLAASGLALTLVVALAGCSKTDNPTASTGSTTAPTVAPGTTAKKGMTKADLIKKADEICKETKTKNAKLEPDNPTDVADVKKSLKAQMENQRDELKQLQALDPPAGSADEWKALIADVKALLDAVDANIDEVAKNIASLDMEAFGESEAGKKQKTAQEDAKAFGLKVCGQASSSSSDTGSGSTSGTGGTTTTSKGKKTTTTKGSDSGSGTGTGSGSGSGSGSGGKLSDEACADLVSAAADLGLATSSSQASAAAERIRPFSPPADVQAAIDVLVAAGGIQFDGSTSDASDTIDNWVNQVCDV